MKRLTASLLMLANAVLALVATWSGEGPDDTLALGLPSLDRHVHLAIRGFGGPMAR